MRLQLVVRKPIVIGEDRFGPGDEVTIPLDPMTFRKLYEARRIGIAWVEGSELTKEDIPGGLSAGLITHGTLPDNVIPASIARDVEVKKAVKTKRAPAKKASTAKKRAAPKKKAATKKKS